MSTNDRTKVSDSGYANTYDNSQSQRSSESSLSRNRNKLESRNPSTSGFSNEAVPQPISKTKDKEHKKKKSKNLTTVVHEHMELVHDSTDHPKDSGIYSHVSIALEQTFKKSEEVGTVELMDATEPSGHNDDTKATIPDGEIGSQINPLDNTSPNTNEEFYSMVSLRDGLVLHSTDSLQTFLGFPKDYWLGKSFIDFLHPDDQIAFADELSKRFLCNNREKDMSLRLTQLFCRLLKYPSGHKEEKNGEASTYIPFHLTLGLKNFSEHKTDEEKSGMLCLIIIAKQVVSAYKAPEETMMSPIFTTRHTATCHFSHVDDDVVKYFGYLPQNMIGRSLFDYYHPEDLPFLKDVYKTVVKLRESSFRSKPYRFAVNNGGYVVLETEWSSFINPWKGKLEFVIGQHRVLRGPMNPNVFQQPDEKYENSIGNISEAVLNESRIIQNEIRTLLKEKIQTSLQSDAPELMKNSDQLLSFVENVINEIKGSKLTAKVPSIAADNKSFVEHNSMMVGEISPHHEYCDSKSSSETLPSYNQLNYNEKIERFFASKPFGNAIYGSDEENINSSLQIHEETGKTSSNEIRFLSTQYYFPAVKDSPNHNGGGSGSGENLSSESNNQTSSDGIDDSTKGNGNSGAFESSQLPMLTENIMNNHNHKQEKLFIQQYKERKSSLKNNKLINDNKIKTEESKIVHAKTIEKTRGTKRTSNDNREDELPKTSKIDEKTKNYQSVKNNEVTVNKMSIDQSQTNMDIGRQTNTVPTLSTTQQYILTSGIAHGSSQCPSFPQIVPIYYAPISRMQDYVQLNNQCVIPQQFWPNSYGMIYPPVIASPISCSIAYPSPMILQAPTEPRENPQPTVLSPPALEEEPAQRKRRASQGTSIKAEPGSVTAMSDSFKKPQSPGGRMSSCISIDGGNFSPIDHRNSINGPQQPQLASTTEDSSDSSFYGSFLNTSSGSSCKTAPALAESLLQNVEAKKYGDACQPKIYGNFAMISELKAISELKEAASHNSPELSDGLRKVGAPWIEEIKMTPEIIYRYQIEPKPLDEVLKNDMKILNANPQSQLVNEQLDQLYLDLELEGFEKKLNLEENNCSSGSDRTCSTESRADISPQDKRIRREIKYSILGMIYEENAPLA